jgi:hypothetical protein
MPRAALGSVQAHISADGPREAFDRLGAKRPEILSSAIGLISHTLMHPMQPHRAALLVQSRVDHRHVRQSPHRRQAKQRCGDGYHDVLRALHSRFTR